MSSSSTETIVDVAMPQMGVSVAEGTVVEWKKQVGDWIEADEIIASISTDKIDTDVESPASGRVTEIVVEVGSTVEVGTVMARIATDAKPGEAHASENDSASSRGTSEAAVAQAAAGEAGELQGDTAEQHSGTAQRGSAAARRSGNRRYSPVVMRIASEHDIDLEQVEGTGRGGRVRKQDVLALRGVRRQRRRHGAADAHREPVPARRPRRPAQAEVAARPPRGGRRRPTPAAAPAPVEMPAGSERPAVAHAPVDRPPHEGVARHRGDLHHDRRGRHDPGRGAAQAAGPDRARVHRAGDGRGAGRVPGAERHARGRDVHDLRGRAPRGRRVARQRRPDRPGHPRRPGPLRRGPGQADQGHRARAPARTSSRRTRSAAARSRSPTRAATARSSPPR